MWKNLGNFGCLFSRKNTRNFYKNRICFMKLLENFEETYSILKKFTKNFEGDFKLLFDMSVKFWISFDEGRWNFNKCAHKNCNRIMKIFWKKCEEISGTICRNKFQDEENFEKISCKRWRNFRVTSEEFLLNLKNFEEIWRFFMN